MCTEFHVQKDWNFFINIELVIPSSKLDPRCKLLQQRIRSTTEQEQIPADSFDFINWCSRYKFWLTNGEPWDFFHYHFSADEFYILPILMVTHFILKMDFWIKDQWSIFETGLRSLQPHPPGSHLQKCHPSKQLQHIAVRLNHPSCSFIAEESTTSAHNFQDLLDLCSSSGAHYFFIGEDWNDSTIGCLWLP